MCAKQVNSTDFIKFYNFTPSFPLKRRTYVVSDSGMRWSSALYYCVQKKIELAKWDTLDKYEDVKFIASSGEH